MGGIGSGGARENDGRKSIDAETRSVISLSLPPRIIKRLRRQAENKGLSVSQLVIDLLEDRI